MSKTSAERIKELEELLAHAEGERDNLNDILQEKITEIKNLKGAAAGNEEALKGAEQKIRSLEADVDTLTARVGAKDESTEKLREQITQLRQNLADKDKQLETLDPEVKARKEIAARKLLEEAEIARKEREAMDRESREADEATRIKAANRKFQLWSMGIGVVATLLIMAITGLVQKAWPPIYLAIGIPVIVAVFALLLPYLKTLAERMAPHTAKHWRKLAHGLVAAPLGITLSSLGIIQNESALTTFAVWLAVSAGFTFIFSFAIEMIHLAFFQEDITEKKARFAISTLAAVAISMLWAAFYHPVGEAWGGAPNYLINALLGMIGFSGLAVVSVLLWILAGILHGVAQFMGEWINGFIKTLADEKRKKKSVWQKAAGIVLAFFAVFIGILIGSSFAFTHSNNGASWVAILMGIGSGVGAAAVFGLIEGMGLMAAFNPKYGLVKKIIVILAATAFASVTAYVSFGWVYYAGSEASRFEETKQELVTSMNNYLQATESNCRMMANSMPKDADLYLKPVSAMNAAKSAATMATDRNGLKDPHTNFMAAASQATVCLSRDERKKEEKGEGLTSKVILYNDPMPSDLSSQYWKGTTIPGVSIHSGAATQAVVVVFLLDYLLPMFMFFVLIVLHVRKSGANQIDHNGEVVSIIQPDDPQTPIHVVVSVGPHNGADIGNGLTVLDSETGQTVGSLRIVESIGDNASMAECTDNTFHPEVGQLVALL